MCGRTENYQRMNYGCVDNSGGWLFLDREIVQV